MKPVWVNEKYARIKIVMGERYLKALKFIQKIYLKNTDKKLHRSGAFQIVAC
jgi:hypothetical protein